MIVRSPAWIVAAAAAAIHLSGIVQQIAQPLGAIGTILSAADKAVADLTGVRTYLASRAVVRPAIKKQATK